jgi:hypothetical protein
MANEQSPWLGQMVNRQACEDAGHIPAVFSPAPLEDLFLAGHCAVCGQNTQFRLGKKHYHPRWGYFFRETLSCGRCGFNSRMRAALHYIADLNRPSHSRVYVTEQVTPLFRHIQTRMFSGAIGSEYLPGEPLGSVKDGVRCEDLQRLTFPNRSFDLIISLDVLEHVPDHMAALRELRRTLRAGGTLVLTAPFNMQNQDIYRQAKMSADGQVEHLIEEPEYHGNPLGPPSLCFNTFGWALLEDMRSAGFSAAYVVPYRNARLGYVGGPFPLIIGSA